MCRFKTLIVSGAVIAAMLLGAVVAYAAGWSWNAQLNVEGVDVRTDWTVVNDQTGESYDSESGKFHAAITASFPKGAQAEVLVMADAETVHLKHVGSLECDSDGVEAEFSYKVTALDTVSANKVVATIFVNGQELGQVTGRIHERLNLQINIPVDGPSCDED